MAAPTILVLAMSIELARALEITVGGDLDRLPIFYRLLVMDRPLALTSLLLLVIALLLVPRVRGVTFHRIALAFAAHPVRVAAVSFAALAAGAHVVYHGHPLSMDEYAPLFQARAFASGLLTGQVSPELIHRLFAPGSLGFFFSASSSTGQVVSNYWPGHALLLSPFALLGAPWLLNPLLAAGSLLLLHRATRELTEDATAPGWTLLFALASPAFIANGISFYSMPAHLFLNLLFMLLVLRRSTLALLGAGVVGSLALTLHNPYAHALFAAPWVLWLMFRHGARSAGALCLGYTPLLLLLGVGWLYVRSRVSDPTLAIEAVAFVLQGETVGEKVRSFFAYVFVVPSAATLLTRAAELVKVWIWAVPALPVLAVLSYRQIHRQTAARLLALSVLLTIGGYVVVSFPQAHGWGSRYFYPAWMVLPLFAAAFVVSGSERERQLRQRFAGLVTLGALIALNGVALLGVKAFIARHLAQIPSDPEAAVILLDPASGYYVGDLIQNDPLLRNRPILLRATGAVEDDRFMAEAFPDLRLRSSTRTGTSWGVPPAGGPGIVPNASGR